MKEKKKSITEIVSSIVENTKCFISQERIVFAEIEKQGKLIIVSIDGEVFKNYLLYKIFTEEQKINTDMINHIILLIKARNRFLTATTPRFMVSLMRRRLLKEQ